MCKFTLFLPVGKAGLSAHWWQGCPLFRAFGACFAALPKIEITSEVRAPQCQVACGLQTSAAAPPRRRGAGGGESRAVRAWRAMRGRRAGLAPRTLINSLEP